MRGAPQAVSARCVSDARGAPEPPTGLMALQRPHRALGVGRALGAEGPRWGRAERRARGQRWRSGGEAGSRVRAHFSVLAGQVEGWGTTARRDEGPRPFSLQGRLVQTGLVRGARFEIPAPSARFPWLGLLSPMSRGRQGHSWRFLSRTHGSRMAGLLRIPKGTGWECHLDAFRGLTDGWPIGLLQGSPAGHQSPARLSEPWGPVASPHL